jgi:hypothetical protein
MSLSVRITRIHGVAITLLALLTACNDGPPVAFLASPEAAVRQGVSRDGWLFEVAGLQFHARQSLPQGEIFLISGELGPEHDSQPTIGLVDAKRSWRGWYAHGWRGLSPKLLDDSQPLQASLLLYESSRVIAGRADATTVEISYGADTTHSQPTPDDLFLAVVSEGRAPCEVRALDARGAEIDRLVVEGP